ncbi:tetratricopeptide repeat protein [Solibacillus silvestris]|uniref:tetratricopeptide repeat protein n=1 Tax=Solibacillus silvestris TaxID=76853 RepID=UPI003F7E7F93
MQLTESKRKYILLGIVTFIIIGCITAKVLASKQDEEFLTNDTLYQQASQLYTVGNYAEAGGIINELLLRQPNSETVNYLGGLIIANLGDYKQSAILLQKALDINPHKVEDAMFMLQFGEVLFFAERYDDSKMVLERCREWGWIPEEYPTYQERITELLTQMENME